MEELSNIDNPIALHSCMGFSYITSDYVVDTREQVLTYMNAYLLHSWLDSRFGGVFNTYNNGGSVIIPSQIFTTLVKALEQATKYPTTASTIFTYYPPSEVTVVDFFSELDEVLLSFKSLVDSDQDLYDLPQHAKIYYKFFYEPYSTN